MGWVGERMALYPFQAVYVKSINTLQVIQYVTSMIMFWRRFFLEITAYKFSRICFLGENLTEEWPDQTKNLLLVMQRRI